MGVWMRLDGGGFSPVVLSVAHSLHVAVVLISAGKVQVLFGLVHGLQTKTACAGPTAVSTHVQTNKGKRSEPWSPRNAEDGDKLLGHTAEDLML